MKDIKKKFFIDLQKYTETLQKEISNKKGEWSIKGFIDEKKRLYTISNDTKIVSKILEIQILPSLIKFAEKNKYRIILAKHQNYYPDISLVSMHNDSIKFALDFKTTYRLPNNPNQCNGFTLGSHGEYFQNRKSTK